MTEHRSAECGRMQCLSENLHFVRGVPFLRAFAKEKIEAIMDMTPEDGDIVIVSFPKTGSTLLQYIVLLILSKGDSYPQKDELSIKVAPVLDLMGVNVLESLKKPRSYKSHIPYNMLQKNEKAKYLYTYRKPEDTLMSYYHFCNENLDKPVNFDWFFENFLLGNLPYGNYFKHVLAIFAHKDDPNVLLIPYEKLVNDRKEVILEIAKFLGENYYQNLVEDEFLLEKIVERTNFDYMKNNLSASFFKLLLQGKTASTEAEKVNFFRKGIIGEGKQMLSAEQFQKLKNIAEEAMKETGLIDEWFKE